MRVLVVIMNPLASLATCNSSALLWYLLLLCLEYFHRSVPMNSHTAFKTATWIVKSLMLVEPVRLACPSKKRVVAAGVTTWFGCEDLDGAFLGYCVLMMRNCSWCATSFSSFGRCDRKSLSCKSFDECGVNRESSTNVKANVLGEMYLSSGNSDFATERAPNH